MRKDGRWAAAVNLGYQSGKQKRKTLYGRTRREVQEKLVAEQHRLKQGLPTLNERQTLAEYLDKWLSVHVKPTVRPKTYRTYNDLAKQHIMPALGKKLLVRLSPQDVQGFLNEKRQSGLSAKTVKHINDTLRAALNVAMKWSLVHRNVATLVTPPRIQKQEMKIFTPEQANLFLDSIKGHRLEALFITALTLGLRRGELLGLRWWDIDFEARAPFLRVNYALQRLEGELQLAEPKTEKSRSALPLPRLLIAALRTHRTRQLEERLVLGSKWQETGFVFTSTIGTPLEPRNLNRLVDGLLVKANKSLEESARLPKIRLHDLRHSCATFLLARGVPIRTVMEILRHSQISLTMNTYAQVMPEMTQAAVGVMDEIFADRQ